MFLCDVCFTFLSKFANLSAYVITVLIVVCKGLLNNNLYRSQMGELLCGSEHDKWDCKGMICYFMSHSIVSLDADIVCTL